MDYLCCKQLLQGTYAYEGHNKGHLLVEAFLVVAVDVIARPASSGSGGVVHAGESHGGIASGQVGEHTRAGIWGLSMPGLVSGVLTRSNVCSEDMPVSGQMKQDAICGTGARVRWSPLCRCRHSSCGLTAASTSSRARQNPDE